MGLTRWLHRLPLGRKSSKPVSAKGLRKRPVGPCLCLERLENRTLLSVNLGTNFQGLNFSQSSGGYVPPDTIAAVGPNHVVEAVNLSLAFYSKSTGALVQPIQSLQSFFAPVEASSILTDPVVTYDPQAGTFVVGVLDVVRNTFDVAVSLNSDPTQGFLERRINVGEPGGFFGLMADYPRFGWNGDSYVFSFNMFDSLFGFFDHVQILGLKKSSFDSSTSRLVGFRADRYGAGPTSLEF